MSLDFHTARQFHPLAMIGELDGDITEASVCELLGQRRLHPTAFGVPATNLASGIVWPAMHASSASERAWRSM